MLKARKRVYKDVAVVPIDTGFGVLLDGRPLMTPMKSPMVTPSTALSEAIAGEWDRQMDTIDPNSMPMTQLATTSIDRVRPERPAIVNGVAAYAENDLLCYRAERPDSLVRRQAEAWDPLMAWCARRYGGQLKTTGGIMPMAQSPESVAAIRKAIEGYDDWRLTGLQSATATSGSVIIALALAEGEIDADAAFEAAELDESHQIEYWGEDPIAADRRSRLRAELGDCRSFLDLL